jgi:predicted transcriptional regulator
MEQTTEDKLLAMTAEIVTATLANPNTPIELIHGFITNVRDLLETTSRKPARAVKVPRKARASHATAPAEPIMDPQEAVTHDHIFCLACGKKTQILQNHLRIQHGMTVPDYLARYNLPHDYPMTPIGFHEMAAARARNLAAKRGPEYMAMLRERRTEKAAAEREGGEAGKTRVVLIGNKAATG